MNAHFRNLALWAIIGLLVVALVMLFQQPGQRTPIRDISFSELLTQIDQGRVHDVTIAGNEITGHFSDNRPFQTYSPNDPSLVQRLQSKNVQISAKPLSDGNSWMMTLLLNGLPLNGETIYARVFTDYNGTHLYKDYTFTAAKQALLTSPLQGATLSGTTVTFKWSAATGGVSGYFLHLGTSGPGSLNLLNSAEYPTSTTSVTVNNLPVNGGTIYARVFTDYNGVHVYEDYTFTAQ